MSKLKSKPQKPRTIEIPKVEKRVRNDFQNLQSEINQSRTRKTNKNGFISVGSKNTGLYIPYGVRNYDYDLYPQYLIALGKNSSTLSSAIRLRKNFIHGGGLLDTSLNAYKINENYTVADFVKYLCGQEARFEAQAFHLNYTLEGKISELNFLQFERLRQEQPDPKGNINNIAIVQFYDAYIYRMPTNNYIEFYPKFSESWTKTQEQIWQNSKDAESFAAALRQFCGQIYYDFQVEDGAFYYPEPVYDTVQIDADTQPTLKESKRADIRDRFKANIVVNEYGVDTNDNESVNAIKESWRPFVESDGSRTVIRTAPSPEMKPDIDVINTTLDLSKQYQYAEQSIKQNIREAFHFPEILYSFSQAGKLGQSQEIENAVSWGNLIVKEQKQRVEQTLKKVFDRFYLKELQNKEWKLKDFSFELPSGV